MKAEQIDRDDHAVTFRASEELVEAAKDWSPPVQFRFVQEKDGHWELQVRYV